MLKWTTCNCICVVMSVGVAPMSRDKPRTDSYQWCRPQSGSRSAPATGPARSITSRSIKQDDTKVCLRMVNSSFAHTIQW